MSDRYRCVEMPAEKFLPQQPDDSIDLLFCSPPYEKARTYGIKEQMVEGEKWVEWMFKIIELARPKVKGLIAVNCEGQTKGFRYSMAPFLLSADLHRAGFNLRKPAIFHRIGIPGSGGPDWLRNDYELVICCTREGKLPWSDNTACGHAPKWAPGGEMAHRLSNGTRVNQLGKTGKNTGTSSNPELGVINEIARPSHKTMTKAEKKANGAKTHTKRNADEMQEQTYLPPDLANPGNVIERKYTAEEVAKIVGEMNDIVKCKVGGGQMGHKTAHRNEAPFPLDLAEFFVKSFCPPDGVVCDIFSGSGTTAHAAKLHGRRFTGCDIRKSQVEHTMNRLRSVTPNMI